MNYGSKKAIAEALAALLPAESYRTITGGYFPHRGSVTAAELVSRLDRAEAFGYEIAFTATSVQTRRESYGEIEVVLQATPIRAAVAPLVTLGGAQ